MACEARQEGDEMACPCGLRWSVADEAPQCRRVRHVVPVTPAKRDLLIGARHEELHYGNGDFTKESLARRFAYVQVRLLVEPSDDLMRSMVAAYAVGIRAGMHPHAAMARAYRVLLDLASG